MLFNLILKEGFFKHPNQVNPCYRKVLCYAFFRYQKNNGSNKALFIFALQRLKNDFDQQEPYNLDGYIGLYPTQFSKNEIGYLVVEASREIYPLVSYQRSVSKFNAIPNKTRYAALKVAIDDVCRIGNKIFKVFDNHMQWSYKIESELEKLFRYKNENFYSIKKQK